MLSVKELIHILSNGRGLEDFGCTIQTVTVKPFDFSAKDFLNFAFQDLKDKSDRGIVNTLSNVKRAIDCRVEELLFCYCLQVKSKHDYWDIPKKLETLANIGILAPRILRRIATLRNRLEHQFEKPLFEKVEDAIDVGQLFLEATEKLCHPITHLRKGDDCFIKIERDNNKIELQKDSSKRNVRIGSKDDWLTIAKLLVAKRTDVMT